jgi:hypothetical protein
MASFGAAHILNRMRFKAKKRYGQSKVVNCAFCGKIATHKSEDGLEVCHIHVKQKMEEIKCTCGSWLEQKVSNFGPYFNCINCGNFNFDRAMEIKSVTMKEEKKQEVIVEKKIYREEPKEITITSDDVEYFS